jgi:hypothetical protein
MFLAYPIAREFPATRCPQYFRHAFNHLIISSPALVIDTQQSWVPHPFHGFIVKWVGKHNPQPALFNRRSQT